jgi:glyoxylate carboligase
VVGRLELGLRKGLEGLATIVFAGAAEPPMIFACGGVLDVDAGGVIQEVSDCHVVVTVFVIVLATVLSWDLACVVSFVLA